MSWIAVGVGVAGVAGAAISADAAGSAAEGQQQATQQANQLQYQMFREQQALAQPTIQAGNTARDSLMYRLGLSPTGTGGPPKKTYDQLRTQLQGQFTRQGQSSGMLANLTPQNQQIFDRATRGQDPAAAQDYRQQLLQSQGDLIGYTSTGQRTGGQSDSYAEQPVHGYGPQVQSSIDEAGLDAEIKRLLAAQDTEEARQRQVAESDPMYGGLARDYTPERYTPEKFGFKREDFQVDPGYQFRLEQGQKALDRKAAAGGRFFSGSALTGASNFAGGMASDEYGNAFQRAFNTFGTNEGNRRNAFALNEGNRFGAYQANFNNAVNPLLSLSGAATLGSQNLGAAGASYGQQVGNNLTNNANAQGAAGIATANQIGNSLTSGVNNYQQNQLMQQMLNRNQSPWASVNNNPYPAGANYAADGY